MGVRVAENLYGKYGVPSLDLVFTSPRAGLKNVAGDSSLEVEFSRTQDTQASYYKSDGTIGYASTDVARFDHDPTTRESLGLLIEEARTNLVSYSGSIGPGKDGFFGNASTVTKNADIAPDGTTTATRLSSDVGFCGLQINVTSGLDYVFSFYVKTSTVETITINTNNAPTIDKVVDVVPGEWTRVYLSFTTTSTGLQQVRFVNAVPGGDELLIWGAQLEQGSFPTSYIPTRPTFTSRASNATYYDVNGNVAFAATDVAREPAYFPDSDGTMIPAGLLLEGEETNDNQYSEYHDQYSTTAAEVIQNQALAPDLSWTASSLVETTDTDYHELLPYPTPSIGSTTRLTFSTFIKNKQGSKNALLRFNDGVDDVGMYFNPSSGSVVGVLTGAGTTTPSNYGSQKLNNDWYRIYVTADATVGTRETAIHIIDNTTYSTHAGTAGTDGFYLWGVQMEQSPFMSSYIESPASFTSRSQTNSDSASFYQSDGTIGYAATDVARDDAYFPDENGVFYPAGLLIEDQATNLVTYSEDFDNASWAKTNVSVTANSVAAPDGTFTADFLAENTAAGLHQLETSGNIYNAVINEPYTYSIHVKPNGRNEIGLGYRDSGLTIFNLSTNSITIVQQIGGGGSITNNSIQALSDGWYRISSTIVDQITYGRRAEVFLCNGGSSSYTGDGSSGAYVWGYQVEEGSYATSYIPTTSGISTRGADFSSSSATTRAADISSSSTSTRGADTAQITGAGFSSFYNQSEGTTYSEYNDIPFGGGMWYFGPGGSPRWWSRYEVTNGIRTQSYDGSGGGGAFNITIPGVTGNANVPTLKHCVAIDNVAQEHSGSANGSAIVTGTWDDITGVSALNLGRRVDLGGNNGYLNAHIKRLTYWPRRLSDSNLQSLTE